MREAPTSAAPGSRAGADAHDSRAGSGAHAAVSGTAVVGVEVGAFTVPTPEPESDATLEWNATTLVTVELHAGGESGLGYTYSSAAAVQVIGDTLWPAVEGCDPMAVEAAWEAMARAGRNLGRPGLVSQAISAVDGALWDLKARLLGIPLVELYGPCRERIDVYGSGGFTSASPERLSEQLGDWAREGIRRVKMKIGRDPERDRERVRAARRAIGDSVELFVDANGAYRPRQALRHAEALAGDGVVWLEEPVSSDDLEGLAFVRERAPAAMDVTAGEYGSDVFYFQRMLAARAVDVLQPDATRCGGPTGFLRASVLCRAHHLPLSAHTAPNLHAHLCCAAVPALHVEWFADHARIEALAFDGGLEPREGALSPDRSRPGNGLALKRADLEPYRVADGSAGERPRRRGATTGPARS